MRGERYVYALASWTVEKRAKGWYYASTANRHTKGEWRGPYCSEESVIGVTKIAEVLRQWEVPSFEEFEQRTAWRLFNAATFALTGRVIENVGLTSKLHNVIDSVCARVQ